MRPSAASPSVDGWRLIRRLGAGAQSQVWLAERAHAAGGVPALAALKLVPIAGEAWSPEKREAWQAQAAIAAALDHPGIARVLGAGVSGEHAWLAMEPVPGGDLQRHTAPARRLPDAVVLRILARVAGALAHAHARGVVHRDVKPANIVVDWAGGVVKLVDFGLARVDGSTRTATGIVPGTPAYMAPELLAGAEPDARTDLYALGVTAFELLVGKRPLDAPTMGELLSRVVREVPPDLRSLRPELSGSLAACVAGLLAKAPDRRPSSAADVAAVFAREAAYSAASTGASAGAPAGAPSRPTGSRAP